ncbi:MAG: transposase [Puniceicoccales bacterium]|nr:transposase [Puniceicoccales bacterium]
MKQIKRRAKIFHFIGRTRGARVLFCIDSTPLPVCKNVRYRNHKTFKNMANWAHSSLSTTLGLKLHLFSLKSGNFALKNNISRFPVSDNTFGA